MGIIMGHKKNGGGLPTDGLIANYKFNGNYMSETGQYNGTPSNCAISTDRYGNNSALSLSGNGRLYTGIRTQTGDNWTLTGWWYDSNGGDRWKASQDIAGDSSYVWLFRGNVLSLYFVYNGTTDFGQNINYINYTNEWVFYGIKFSSNNISIFQKRIGYNHSIYSTNYPYYRSDRQLILGGRESSDGYFIGKIDDVKVFTRLLSDDELLALANE